MHMPPTSEPKPTPPQVLISLASEGARQAARACVMAMRVPPTELAPGPQLVQRLRDMLHAFPSSAALVDLAHLQAGAVHIAALAAALPDASQREARGRQPTGVTAADHPLLHELEYQGHSIDGLEFEFTLDAIIAGAEKALAQSKSAARARHAK